MILTAASIAISLLALLASLIRTPRFEFVRHWLVFFALGAGNIHIAVVSLAVLLFVNSGYRLPIRRLGRTELIVLGMVGLIALISLFSPITGRTITKLLHLGLFVFIAFQLMHEFASAERIRFYLRCMVYGAAAMALLAIALSFVGLTETPHIYLARGSNEGSIFVTFMGVLPALTLMLWERRPHYLALAAMLAIAPLLAVSRSNTAVSAVMLAGTFYFLFNRPLIKAAMLVAAGTIIYHSRDLLSLQIGSQINYSALQRIELTRYGWDLWTERPLTGWGWGSTSNLVPQAMLVDIEYPHFHNTWVQILAETGAVGWLIIALFAWFGIRCVWISLVRLRSPAISAYVSFALIGIVWLGFFEALTFGADRMVQLVLMLPIMGNMISLGLEAQREARAVSATAARDARDVSTNYSGSTAAP